VNPFDSFNFVSNRVKIVNYIYEGDLSFGERRRFLVRIVFLHLGKGDLISDVIHQLCYMSINDDCDVNLLFNYYHK
jgi:hypothetical protein